MSTLNDIAFAMRKFPRIKKFLKVTYQYIGYILSDKKTQPQTLVQISDDKVAHMFGYYDKCPWNKDEDKIIFMEAKNINKNVASIVNTNLIIKDLKTKQEKIIGATKCWNSQQGCMLQWMGPDFNSKIIYNDYIDNELKSIIYNINTNENTIINTPIYDIDANGKYAFTLDFYRLHRLRPRIWLL